MATSALIAPVANVPHVTLTLDRDEADMLVILMGSVGGDPDVSARKLTDRVLTSLERTLGYDRSSDVPNRGRFAIEQGHGAIYFEETTYFGTNK